MYATLSDVTALTGRAADGSTQPNATEITGFLESTAAELDALLAANGYVVPVPTTATSAFRLIRHYNAQGAACLTLRAAPTGKKDVDTSSCAAYKAAKEAIAAGGVTFPDLGRDTGRTRARASSPTARFADCETF